MAKILIIDDCDEFREAVGELLREQGHEIDLAGSAEAGLARCEESKFDVVLCDLALPLNITEGMQDQDQSAMVGVHAIYHLSRKYPDVPVIAISGQLTGDPLSAISKFGAKSCLSKPFQATDLFRLIDEELRNKAGSV